MTKSWAWISLLLLLAIASAAVIPAGKPAHTSTPSTSPSSTERTPIPTAFLEQQKDARGGQTDSVGEGHGRQQDGSALNRMLARRQLTQVTAVILVLPRILSSPNRPFSGLFRITTLTVVRTVTVELPSQTRVVFSPVEQTLTIVNPVLVFETRVITASQPSGNIAARDLTEAAASDPEFHSVTLPVYASPSKEATLLSKAGRVRRQNSNPITRVSTITVEIIRTLTNVCSVRTVTVFDPVYVSVTENQIVTTTTFTTTTPSIETTTSRSSSVVSPAPPADPALSSSDDELTDTTEPFSTTSPTSNALSPSASSTTFTSVLGSASTSPKLVPSETSADAGVTGPGAQPPTGSTATSSTQSEPTSGTNIASSRSTELPTPEAAPEAASDPALSPGTIASITLGAVTALLIFLFLGFVYQRYRKFLRSRQHPQSSKRDYRMTSASAASAIMDKSAPDIPDANAQGQGVPSETSSNKSSEGEQVRIVIHRVVSQTDDSSEVPPLPKSWPLPPGNTGQVYGVIPEESGEATPRDVTGWSTTSEYGSTLYRDVSRNGVRY
ncbi:uncharacterized protein ColSpa_09756 [Colletotrichum spaethianum]|uniref:Uncharacterized protein n=1 Tax=Colletotrichum spaethianum TaxID=700344 RepID=A0AA37UNZ1_9PEZI|nr:uncharacterized protein ColSpa_09756 [Colletotrichum spaethianum]GKT49575.1 hypothetical protein ColSpa_09756 [Colletotrichum spaethianum]